MTRWAIHEVAAACRLTEHEISAWISRGHFKSSVAVRPGQRRQFDWRDLACLAVMRTLREQSIVVSGIASVIAALRDNLERIDEITAASELYLISTGRSDTSSTRMVGLVNSQKLCQALQSPPSIIVVVNVTEAYQEAVSSIVRYAGRPLQKTPPDEPGGACDALNGQSRME